MKKFNLHTDPSNFPLGNKAQKKYSLKSDKIDKLNWSIKFRSLTSELSQNWLEVLRGKSILQDTLAAITVASVALPLNIALAVACGLPASAGLLAGAIGGGIAAIFGGASLQVTGPAAALNVMVLALTIEFGPVGVAAACLIIGLIQVFLCTLSAGKLIRFVPETVLTGFTTGVGLKLLDSQIPELLGFKYNSLRLEEMFYKTDWLKEVSWLAVVCGLFVALLVISCKQFRRFPAAFVGIFVVTAVSINLNWDIERVGIIPAILPVPSFPLISSDRWLQLFIATFPLAFLASIESLLSAQAIDKLSNSTKPHNSNLELLGQGFANIGTGLVGGMPVSGVVVRSSVNVQSGARTRLSSLLHAVILLISILYLSDTMAAIPLAALAGLLCVVGIRLIEVKSFLHLLQNQKLEAVSFLLAAAGTMSGHLLLGLGAGIIFFLISRWLEKPQEKVLPKSIPRQNIRAVLAASNIRQNSKRPVHYEQTSKNTSWLNKIREKAYITASAFVHHRASLIGRIVLGEHVHIAAESSIRADEGAPFYIGSNSNIQDGVVIHALKEKWVNVGFEDWAVYIGENVSIAHQALIHGPCYIGNKSFVGFQAVVHDSIIGSHCYIGIGAIVVGVEIPDGRYVPHGMVVDSLDKVETLPHVTDAHMNFNEDVVDVNKGLVAAYKKHNKHFIGVKNHFATVHRKWRIAIDRF